jgi:hypothetical protein
MNDAPHRSPAKKPSGPVTYTITKGADVWPGIGKSDKAFIRDLNGEMVIFQEFRGRDGVAVSIGGQDRVLPFEDWRQLPPYRD